MSEPDLPVESSTPALKDASLGEITRTLHVHLTHLGNGDQAALRRAQGRDYSSSALWRLLTLDLIAHSPYGGQEHERHWATLLSLMAHDLDASSPAVPLGRALAQAGVSELRLTRLLNAAEVDERGELLGRIPLHEELRRSLAIVRSKRMSVQWEDVAKLLFYRAPHDMDTRRTLARLYFNQLHKDS